MLILHVNSKFEKFTFRSQKYVMHGPKTIRNNLESPSKLRVFRTRKLRPPHRQAMRAQPSPNDLALRT